MRGFFLNISPELRVKYQRKPKGPRQVSVSLNDHQRKMNPKSHIRNQIPPTPFELLTCSILSWSKGELWRIRIQTTLAKICATNRRSSAGNKYDNRNPTSEILTP